MGRLCYNYLMYEVYLTRKVVGAEVWRDFLGRLADLHRQGERVEIIIAFDGVLARMFVKSRRELPHFLTGADGFVVVKTEDTPSQHTEMPSVSTLRVRSSETILNLKERLATSNISLAKLTLVLRRALNGCHIKYYATIEKNGIAKICRLHGTTLNILDLDFRKSFALARPPKYLNVAKTLSLFSPETNGAVLKLRQFPYFNEEHFLTLKNIDFYKHTAVFGASGAGKSKFLAKFISEVANNYGDKYHFLVIDPHDALRDEIGGAENVKVFDYTNSDRGLDLFVTNGENIINSVEMTLGLIKTLATNWNAKVERLTRACLYLLIEKGELSLQNLRKILTDAQYKNTALASVADYLPESLQEFFGQDYNELKTRHYDATFALIISLIDELQLTPAIYRQNNRRLEYEISANKVTLVSLNIAKHGERAVKILAGLIMNQLFALGMQRKLSEHIILVVDEVAVIENPVLTRFLAEARKYNISVVLAGQYYTQISNELKTAIYANTANYFCFRLNYDDAEHLMNYLDIELCSGEQVEFADTRLATFQNDSTSRMEQARLLTTLPDRQVVARVSRCGILMPAVMGESMDYTGAADRETVSLLRNTVQAPEQTLKKRTKIRTATSSAFDLMREQSTSRRKLS